VFVGREDRHVAADLSDDSLGCALLDSRDNRAEQPYGRRRRPAEASTTKGLDAASEQVIGAMPVCHGVLRQPAPLRAPGAAAGSTSTSPRSSGQPRVGRGRRRLDAGQRRASSTRSCSSPFFRISACAREPFAGPTKSDRSIGAYVVQEAVHTGLAPSDWRCACHGLGCSRRSPPFRLPFSVGPFLLVPALTRRS
jgi:hypothetical protein